jgi:hypothetical protein
VCEIPAGDGLGALGFYISILYPYVLGMGAATAVLMGLIGGIEWMTAGSDAGKVSAGRTRMLTSLGGLILLLSSSAIMHFINPFFFR